MRSKEVDDAIMYIQDHLDFFITEKVNIERDLIETVLNYISELEEENLTQRSQINSAFDNGFIHKDNIRDKIKKIEEDKQTILQAIEEAKESKDEEFLNYNREILYRINGEISVLKELLGE